ncbi:MAG: AI-2E family transporter [Thermomicrobiales bacterium]
MSTPDGHRDAPPVRTIRHEISLRSLFSILAIVGGCWLLLRLWNVVLLLVIALILAGTVSPAVDWLERHRIKRALALGLILLALVVAVVGLGALVIPAFVAQVHDLITAEPQIRRGWPTSRPAFRRWPTAPRRFDRRNRLICLSRWRPKRCPSRARRRSSSSWP